MSLQITEEDDPNIIQKRAEHCAKLVLESLPIALARVKQQPVAIRQMVNAARFEGMVPGYKSLSVAFPTLSSKGSWCVIYPWSHVEDYTADELADYIIDTVKRYVKDKRKKGG